MSRKKIQIEVSVDREEFNTICKKVLPKIPNTTYNQTERGFQLKENKMDMLKGTYAANVEIEYNDCIVSLNAKCAGLGPIQQKHVVEIVTIVKNVIERGVLEKDIIIDEDVVRCPKCGSRQIQIQKRGWSLLTGMIGSSKNERVCVNCMYKF